MDGKRKGGREGVKDEGLEWGLGWSRRRWGGGSETK